MSKYNIEGGIDFFSELYKSLDIEENNQKIEEDNNLCLITNQLLVDKHVKLECGHKFNYIPLFNDIKNHKQKFNNLEGCNSKLKTNEIRCPYCRYKQNGVLPYYEELNIIKINGVNFYDPSLNIMSNDNWPKCKYLTANVDYNPDGKNPIETSSKYSGKNSKFFTCMYAGHYHISQIIPNYHDFEMITCSIHKNIIVKEYNLNLKNKAKEEAKKIKEEAKQKAKEEKQKVKEEKQKEKEEKQKAKKNKKQENKIIGLITDLDINNSNNVLNNNIDTTNNVLNDGCIEIIKSGIKKGLQCGAKKLISDGYRCKRHFNLLINKSSTEETISQILPTLGLENNS